MNDKQIETLARELLWEREVPVPENFLVKGLRTPKWAQINEWGVPGVSLLLLVELDKETSRPIRLYSIDATGKERKAGLKVFDKNRQKWIIPREYCTTWCDTPRGAYIWMMPADPLSLSRMYLVTKYVFSQDFELKDLRFQLGNSVLTFTEP